MKWGIKISKFIDIINRSTRIVNRLINLSSAIYTVENISTFAEINKTVQEKSIPIGSAIKVNIIGVEATDIIFHSNSII
jgi:hypothetical protein